MKKRIDTGWILFGIAVLVLAWNTIDLIHMFDGWHLAFRTVLNIILLAIFVAGLLVSKNQN